VGFERFQEDWRDPLHFASASVAFVGDNSYAAFTSPVRGERFRVGAEVSYGTVNFRTLTFDYRRYFNNGGPMTLAFRGLHLGRYGDLARLDEEQLGTYFMGFESFLRGYAWNSFDSGECSESTTISLNGSTCPLIDRLYGHRLGIANIELRLPFTGIEEFGLVNFPYVPIEFTAFTDVGLAWDSERPAELSWARDTTARVPVASSGVSARMNLLGFLIMEAYYAYPWQRPLKGWHWGVHVAPGW
jgi:hypothetical protein